MKQRSFECIHIFEVDIPGFGGSNPIDLARFSPFFIVFPWSKWPRSMNCWPGVWGFYWHQTIIHEHQFPGDHAWSFRESLLGVMLPTAAVPEYPQLNMTPSSQELATWYLPVGNDDFRGDQVFYISNLIVSGGQGQNWTLLNSQILAKSFLFDIHLVTWLVVWNILMVINPLVTEY